MIQHALIRLFHHQNFTLYGIYLKHDHTYCCFDPENITKSPTICESDQCNSSSCERETVMTEDKKAMLLELAVTPTQHLQIEPLTHGQTQSPL